MCLYGVLLPLKCFSILGNCYFEVSFNLKVILGGKIISKHSDWDFLTRSWQSNFPSRLLWTKAAYDYMYASGETLLRNFPVQATIQVIDEYDDSDDDDDDEEVEEECGEQDSTKKCKQ